MNDLVTPRNTRPRTICPDCGRDVAFVTDLEFKWLAPHNKPGTRRRCVGRKIRVEA